MGESLGLSREEATVERLVAALRKMGFNYIFDTNFSADLTIMEEGNEFLEKLKDRKIMYFLCLHHAVQVGYVFREMAIC